MRGHDDPVEQDQTLKSHATETEELKDMMQHIE